MFYIFTFIFGLLFGSFLNVVIFWLESQNSKQQTVNSKQKKRHNLFGRSFCPECKHKLGFWDLIPLFSWIFLRAKCRYCRAKISIQYPLVELATGLLFMATFYFTQAEYSVLNTFSILGATAILLTVNCLLFIIFVYDLKHKIIPDKVMYPAIWLAVCSLLLAVWVNYLGNDLSLATMLYPLAAAFGAGGFFYTLAAVSDGKWMGGGDIKLAFFMGLFLGFPNILVAMFIGFFSGAIIGLALMAFGKKKLQSEIPFGPFLISGTWIALFWGDKVVQWYMRGFL